MLCDDDAPTRTPQKKPSPVHPAFAEKLRRFRESHGLSVVDLAAGSGLSKSSIYQYERGDRFPRYPHARALARCLGVSTDLLLSEDVPSGDR